MARERMLAKVGLRRRESTAPLKQKERHLGRLALICLRRRESTAPLKRHAAGCSVGAARRLRRRESTAPLKPLLPAWPGRRRSGRLRRRESTAPLKREAVVLRGLALAHVSVDESRRPH